MSSANNKTGTCYRSIDSVTVSNLRQMYELYSKYYERTSLDIFLQDISKKSGVLLVYRKSDEKIVGFSTIQFFDSKVDGKRVRVVFSGDTVVEKEYWGRNGIVQAFMRRLLIERLRHPLVPFYWFLISKGYKTFLILTNNFYNYYPNIQGDNPRYKRVVEEFCAQTFNEAFDRERMLLDFGHDYVSLKESVADITPEDRLGEPNIAFFEQRNPSWQRGTELPCLASFDLTTAFRKMFVDMPAKFISSQLFGSRRRSAKKPARPAAAAPATPGHAFNSQAAEGLEPPTQLS